MRNLHLLALFVLLSGCPEPPGGTLPDDDDDDDCQEVDAWLDGDGDGWGGARVPSCDPPDGTVARGGDCLDEDPGVFPGAEEACDGLDGDCDGVLPADEQDGDGDGLTGCEGDCDDDDAHVRPGVLESCDGVDTDCDPKTSELDDLDGDGASLCDGDCDDGEPLVHPGGVDLCNGLDDDCDGAVDGDLGAVVLVPEDCDHLQWALDAAPDGATVLVGPGVWPGSFTRTGAGVHLAGAAGAVETMLDGLDPGTPTLSLEGAGVSSVQRLVLLGGGGGLAARDTDLTLSSIIADGSAGAGIAVRGGSLTVEHVITLDNAGSGLSIIEAEAEIAWLISIGNRAGTQGGGLYLESSEVTLSQSAVVGNMSMTRGGGVANILGELEMTGTVIWANDAQVGGGLHAEPPADPDVTISWSNIQGNTPDDLDPDPGWPDAFEGGISAAPAFLGVDVTGDPQQWDLHISTSSANVDAGPPGTDDPDGSPADIGPFGGAEADGWDLDGDGWPLWWRPGPYVPGDADCDDLDPDVHPGSGC